MIVTRQGSFELSNNDSDREFVGSEDYFEDDLDSFPDDASEVFDLGPVNTEPVATDVDTALASFDHPPGDTVRQYQYSELEKNSQFRLLVLKPKIGPWDDTIRCELRTEDLDEDACRPDFEALSYTWGRRIDLFKIWIGDRFIRVTENLRDALQNLRYNDRDRFLWVDAVCINQAAEVEGRSDEQQLDEKTVQVRQMGSIYQKANSVLVWLGLTELEDEQLNNSRLEDDRLFQFLDTRREEQDHMEYLKLRWKTWPHDKNEVREGLVRMLQHDWFERVWIIQEIALSRSCHILRGEHSVSSDIFVQLPQLLEVKPRTHCQQILNIMPRVKASDASQSMTSDTERAWRPQELRTLLEHFRDSKSTQAVDKIYALLGLSTEHECVDGAPLLDYNKTERDVVRDTIATLLPGLPKYELPLWTLEKFWNILDTLERALLMHAASEGWATLFKMLLQTMATRPKPPFDDELLSAALFSALERSNARVVAMIVETGRLDLNCCNDEGDTALDIVLRPFDYYGSPDQDRFHPDGAEYDNNDKIIMILLGTGSIHTDGEEVQDRLAKWWCTKFFAVSPRRKLDLDSALRMLIEVGVRKCDGSNGRSCLLDAIRLRQEDLVDRADQSGRAPLSYAAYLGYSECVELLLNTEKVDIDSRDHGGRTPLSYAAKSGSCQAVELLLNTKKVNIDSRDQAGRTPLSHAAESDDSCQAIELLLNTKAVDVDSQDQEGRTPLSYAAQNQSCQAIKLLLETDKVDVNSQDRTGRTALNWAIRAGLSDSRTIEMLLDLGKADPNIADRMLQTPYYCASRLGLDEIARLLAGRMQPPPDA